MKKTSHLSIRTKKAFASGREIAPFEDPSAPDALGEEAKLADEQLSVVGAGDEAVSCGRRVEPIQPDEEHNAENLIEEGLHGYLHASLKKSRTTR